MTTLHGHHIARLSLRCGCLLHSAPPHLWRCWVANLYPQVVAVGPGREEDGKAVKPKVDVGATVLYSKYSGTEVRLWVGRWAWLSKPRCLVGQVGVAGRQWISRCPVAAPPLLTTLCPVPPPRSFAV